MQTSIQRCGVQVCKWRSMSTLLLVLQKKIKLCSISLPLCSKWKRHSYHNYLIFYVYSHYMYMIVQLFINNQKLETLWFKSQWVDISFVRFFLQMQCNVLELSWNKRTIRKKMKYCCVVSKMIIEKLAGICTVMLNWAKWYQLY